MQAGSKVVTSQRRQKPTFELIWVYMPILWRYILSGYFRSFFLSVLSFIFILLVSRFKEIARFAALSDEPATAFLFILYQIPLILPIAIPISSFLATFLLFQRLSHSFELTAMRASTFSLHRILTPIIFAALLGSLLNFSLCSEIVPACRRASKGLFYEETSSNPLLLLGRKYLIKVKTSYLHIDENSDGKIAKNVLFISPNQGSHRLMLIAAKELQMTNGNLTGENVSMVSYLSSEKEDEFDPLMIEHQHSMSTDAQAISLLLKKRRPRFDAASLSIPMLRLMGKESDKKAIKSTIEIIRRCTLSITVFTFTLAGAAFGIENGRNPSRKKFFFMASLLLFVILSYLLGKEMKSHVLMTSLILFLPHPIAWTISFVRLFRIAQGKTG